MFGEEVSHQQRDFVAIRFEGEVACVEQMELPILQVPLVRCCSVGRENLVILAPDDQHGRSMRAEIFLPLRILRRIIAVTEKEVELNLVVPLRSSRN